MLCAGKSILLTRCSQNRVVACAAPQQQPKKVSATLASVNPSPAASSAPSEPKKAAQKSPAPTTTQAVKPKKVRAPRALSPYNYFVKTNFTRIAALHPERKGVPAMSREISAAWDALSEKDKAPYLAAAEKSKKEVSEKRVRTAHAFVHFCSSGDRSGRPAGYMIQRCAVDSHGVISAGYLPSMIMSNANTPERAPDIC